MTRFCFLLMLMVLSSSAYAGESFSFAIGGHRIRIEAPRNCNSASCVSVSIPGSYEPRRKRERDDDDTAIAAAKPPAPEPVLTRPVAPPPSKASIEPVVSTPAPLPAAVKPVACAPQEVAAPRPPASQPAIAPPVKITVPVAPPVALPIAPPVVVTKPAPNTAAKISKVSHEADDESTTTPLGDWQTEGKRGTVRIEPCGRALCGYVLDSAWNAAGETVLINMKPTSASEWSGNIYSRDSKNTYYATIAIRGPNSLRVEACALGHFFCSGNVWSRIGVTPERLISSRQISLQPQT